MYLRNLHVEHNGPLHLLKIELPFSLNNTPIPLLLVGGNGSGKTSLISIIADSLFQAAANHYTNVFVGAPSNYRPYFRIVGPATISAGASGGFTILEFEDHGKSYYFKEKAGYVVATEVVGRLADSLRVAAVWPDNDSFKDISIEDEVAGRIFEDGVYAYFPSNRSEIPHWLNRESVDLINFDDSSLFTKKLRRPILVERTINLFEQWISAVILESRVDMAEILAGDISRSVRPSSVLMLANRIISIILDSPGAYFVWNGRHSQRRIGIANAEKAMIVPSLDALSSGQSNLMSIFGTILRYADHSKWLGSLPADEIAGICLIDEIDAHMHIDMQDRGLPALIGLFPKLQFIISSHSPLFVLSMEKTFSPTGVKIVEMPSGSSIRAEAFAEFGHAFKILQDTRTFAAEIERVASSPGKLLILTEGETDPLYLEAAVDLLNYQKLASQVEFAWIGAKDLKSGQGFNTGKDALNHALSLFKAKSHLFARPILLLYDNDTMKVAEDIGLIHVRTMPSNLENDLIEAGIENLLDKDAIIMEMFEKTIRKKKNGSSVTNVDLNKMRLCDYLCNQKKRAEDFNAFRPLLDEIERLI